MREQGLNYKLNFGVPLNLIKEIANKYEPSEELAEGFTLSSKNVTASSAEFVNQSYDTYINIKKTATYGLSEGVAGIRFFLAAPGENTPIELGNGYDADAETNASGEATIGPVPYGEYSAKIVFTAGTFVMDGVMPTPLSKN